MIMSDYCSLAENDRIRFHSGQVAVVSSLFDPMSISFFYLLILALLFHPATLLLTEEKRATIFLKMFVSSLLFDSPPVRTDSLLLYFFSAKSLPGMFCTCRRHLSNFFLRVPCEILSPSYCKRLRHEGKSSKWSTIIFELTVLAL